MQAAEETLRELNVDMREPVDVYTAIGELGLWLVFRPLGNLLGAIVPHGTGGVLVTSQRGPGLQRFTAAHEIGHWVMDREQLSLDDEADVLRRRDNERERAAQIFAAYFLMPPPLVFASVNRLGVDLENVAPKDVYRLARDMQSSYEATARHLTNMRLLDPQRRDMLLTTTRATAKSQLTGGRAAAGEVWDVGPSDAGTVLALAPGDEVLLALPESPSTGYLWTLPGTVDQIGEPAPAPPLAGDCPELADVADAEPTPASQQRMVLAELPAPASVRPSVLPVSRSAFHVVGDAYLPAWATEVQVRRPDTTRRRRFQSFSATSDLPRPATSDDAATDTGAELISDDAVSGRLGGAGHRLLALRADRAGAWRIHLDYERPFEPDSTVGSFEVLAHVLPSDPPPYELTDRSSDSGDEQEIPEDSR
jgi:predicted secreted protein